MRWRRWMEASGERFAAARRADQWGSRQRWGRGLREEEEEEEEEGRLRLRLLRALDGPPPNVVAKEEVEAELLVKLRSTSERDCGKLVVG